MTQQTQQQLQQRGEQLNRIEFDARIDALVAQREMHANDAAMLRGVMAVMQARIAELEAGLAEIARLQAEKALDTAANTAACDPAGAHANTPGARK